MAQAHIPAPLTNFHALQHPTTGQYWDHNANSWTAPPGGSGPWDAKFALAKVQAGGTLTWGITIPDDALDKWQIVSWYVDAPTVNQFPNMVTPNVEAAGAPTPVSSTDQTPVPAERTSVVTQTDDGLVSERPISVPLGVEGLYAIDFAADLAKGNTINTVNFISPISAGGAISGALTGRDRQLVKVRLQGTTLGKAFLRANVTALGSEHVSEAVVEYQVVTPPTS